MRFSQIKNSLSAATFARALAFGLLAGFVSTPALAVGELSMPVWEDLFNPNGTFKDEVDELGVPQPEGNGVPDYIDIYDGLEAEFIQDNISDGKAVDMSALLNEEILSESILFNGTVDGVHDLGNAYFLATADSQGNPQLYVAVERLYMAADTFIEFEFNQGRVHLGLGAPWMIKGGRTDGDLLVRMNFIAGLLDSVEVEQWQLGVFQAIVGTGASPGDGCTDMTTYVFCVRDTPIDHPTEGFEVWDTEYNLVERTPPDDFVEIGLDVAALLGAPVNFSGIQIRTEEDIAMNSFKVLGQ